MPGGARLTSITIKETPPPHIFAKKVKSRKKKYSKFEVCNFPYGNLNSKIHAYSATRVDRYCFGGMFGKYKAN